MLSNTAHPFYFPLFQIRLTTLLARARALDHAVAPIIASVVEGHTTVAAATSAARAAVRAYLGGETGGGGGEEEAAAVAGGGGGETYPDPTLVGVPHFSLLPPERCVGSSHVGHTPACMYACIHSIGRVLTSHPSLQSVRYCSPTLALTGAGDDHPAAAVPPPPLLTTREQLSALQAVHEMLASPAVAASGPLVRGPAYGEASFCDRMDTPTPPYS